VVAIEFDEEHLTEDDRSPARYPQPSAEIQAIHKQMDDCVQAILDRLPESQKMPLLLSEIENLTDVEIADTLGASINSVKIRLHRARARPRKELGSSCRIFADSRNEVACNRSKQSCRSAKSFAAVEIQPTVSSRPEPSLGAAGRAIMTSDGCSAELARDDASHASSFEMVRIRKTDKNCALCEDYAKAQRQKPVAVLSCEGRVYEARSRG
jgi:hypothetical protein